MLLFVLIAATVALAKPPIERVVHIDAPPEVVFELVADVEGWAEWADVALRGTDASFVSMRGGAYSREQELRWAGSGLGAGRIRLLDAHDDHIAFDLVRTTPAGFGMDSWTRWRQTTELRWRANNGGTDLRWITDTRNMTARTRNVEEAVDVALDALTAAAELKVAPRPHAETRTVSTPLLAVWQGFEHQWTYNHRINRLGSWLTAPHCEGDQCTTDMVHAAASGTGADEATFNRYAQWVSAPGMRSHYGTSTLWFTGREGLQLEDSHCLAIPEAVPGGAALLAGFDIAAINSAHSLWGFSVEVGSEEVDDEEVLCITGRLRMACRTPECRRDRFTEYAVDVHWAYVNAPDLEAWPTALAPNTLAWEAHDLREMLHAEDHVQHHTLRGTPDLSVATAALTAVDIQLDRPLHTIEINASLVPKAHRVEQGELDVDFSLFYRQWGPVEVAPGTLYQLSKAGTATLSAKVVLLQFPEGCVQTAVRPGTLYWPGGGLAASGKVAESVERVPFSAVGCPKPPE